MLEYKCWDFCVLYLINVFLCVCGVCVLRSRVSVCVHQGSPGGKGGRGDKVNIIIRLLYFASCSLSISLSTEHSAHVK